VSVQQNLSAVAGNDLKYHVAITLAGETLDLTLYTPLAVLKASATATDGSGITFGIGSGLTYTYQTFGRFDWVIPHADTTPSGQMWYRIDIDNGSTLVTAMYGTVTLIAA
jgi:hypothetical protein